MDEYIVYKTTNKVNGKYYIGVHKKGIERRGKYLGSGKVLKSALKKYGRDAFSRETLFAFDNEVCAYEKEANIVNEELLKDTMCYNLVLGGGCPPLQTLNGIDHHSFGYKHSKEARIKMSVAKTGKRHPNYGKHRSGETRRKISESQIGKVVSAETKERLSKAGGGENHRLYGKHRSGETRRKISESLMGKNHPMYGKKGKPHTEETRKKISESKLKRCNIKGIIFNSGSSAAEYYNVSKQRISAWIKNPNKTDCYNI